MPEKWIALIERAFTQFDLGSAAISCRRQVSFFAIDKQHPSQGAGSRTIAAIFSFSLPFLCHYRTRGMIKWSMDPCPVVDRHEVLWTCLWLVDAVPATLHFSAG